MPDPSLEHAVHLHNTGRFAEAESIYRQILAIHPRHPDALHLLGLIAAQHNHVDAAFDLFNQAIAAAPTIALFHISRGELLGRLGKLTEELAAYQHAATLDPDLPTLPAKMALTLFRLNRRDEAIEQMRRAVQLNPHSAESHSNLGGALLTTVGETDEALEEFRTAIRLAPDWAIAHRNLAITLAGRGAVAQALTELRRAITLAPNESQFHSELLLWLMYSDEATAADILAEHRNWAHRFADPLAAEIRPHENDPSPTRRLRIGYVSAEHRTHPISAFLLPLLQHHDPANFEVFIYSSVLHPDETTQKLRESAHVWRDAAHLSDADLADRIRHDKIDILIDLSLHSYGNRLLVFARKPAPLQITWLAYPGTTGLSTMDYRLTDPHLDPPENDAFYTERSLRLPHCYWCYTPSLAAPPDAGSEVPRRAGSPDAPSPITFGCFNNFAKSTPTSQHLWARVLAAIPHSRLLISSPPGHHRGTFLHLLATHAIAPERIEFFHRVPLPDYFSLYHRIDILLDPTPFGGGTTTLDALWMGVPVITLAGNRAVGRGGVSILTNLGLPELIAHSPDEYVSIATHLAADPSHLAELRATLPARMQRSPLMDIQAFTSELEGALRRAWEDRDGEGIGQK